MSAITDWITAVSAVVSAIGVVFAARQLQLSRQQFLDDHARSRREVAVQLFADWAKNLDRRATSARKFVQELSQEEVKCIFNSEELSIDSKHASRLAAALRESPPAEDGGKIRLSVEISSEIRWQLVTYLNNLEAVLSAWHHEIADRNLIEEQYRFLIDDGNFIVENFRKTAGGAKTYPSIESFVVAMKERDKPVSQGPTGRY